MCLTDSRMFLPGLNLTYTDRSTMAASTEVRVPFVDVEVVKAAFRIPGSRKVAHRQGKVALKEAALSILPKEIVYRPKGLFSAPLRAWMSRDLAPLVRRGRRGRPARLLRLPAPGRAAPARRRGRRGPAGPLEAPVAHPDAGAVVPQRDVRRCRQCPCGVGEGDR